MSFNQSTTRRRRAKPFYASSPTYPLAPPYGLPSTINGGVRSGLSGARMTTRARRRSAALRLLLDTSVPSLTLTRDEIEAVLLGFNTSERERAAWPAAQRGAFAAARFQLLAALKLL
jgi:hypothetical protein